jgi:tetratricopeptide (TPR) repeat protein
LQEVLALGSKLLADNRSTEAYSLLLVAQSAEQRPQQQESKDAGTDPLGVVPSSLTESNTPSVDWQPSEPTIIETTIPPAVEPTSEPVSSKPQNIVPEPAEPEPIEIVVDESEPLPVENHPSEEALFTNRGEDEPDTALYDAGETKAEAADPEKRPEEPKQSRGPRAPRPRPVSSPFPKTAVLVGIAALALIIVLTLVFFFTGGEKIPVEALDEAAGYLNNGNHALAVNAYSNILSTHGDAAPAYLGRGRAHLGAGQIEDGIADLVRAAELEPETPSIAEELADVLYTRGRFEEAIRYYQQALSVGEIGAEASYRLASSLVEHERPEEAPEHLKRALEMQPSHGEARLLYGSLLNATGDFPEAEKVLRGAQSPIDSGGDYYNELGVSLLEQGKLEEAEEVAGLFLNQDPNGARPRALLGEIYLRRKQYEPARRELIQALRINPQEPRAQIGLGRTWLAIGKTRGDSSDLAKARQILTNARGVHEGERLLTLGEVSLAEGDATAAVNLIEESISHDANPLSARLVLAEAKYVTKDLQGTAEELGRAAGLAPTDPALALSLGLVYYELKDGRRATEEFLKAIQGVGMSLPEDGSNGPVVLPNPYIPLPARFNVNRIIRAAYRQALSEIENDETALQLKTLAESTSFVISPQN